LDLASLIKESLAANSALFMEVLEDSLDLLKSERGRIGNFTVIDRLVKVDPLGEALVIGDLHGDLASLKTILQESGFIQKMQKIKEASIVFLGDYGDRGANSAEVYYIILKLKLAFPKQVILLRGNHEGPKDLIAYPHDLPLQFQKRFSTDWANVYRKTRNLFDLLYNAVWVEERYLMVHGGLSPKIDTLEDIAEAGKKQGILEDLLWSDPDETVQEFAGSPRGAGKVFGKKATNEILGKLNVKILIRGHEFCEEGFKLNHDDRVLTLFSTKGAPYFNRFGAYLDLQLPQKLYNANQLVPWIRRF
jgi:diadenosine tetraphosphatase ApaH/serine/threonine PP2A family protein phosphatase